MFDTHKTEDKEIWGESATLMSPSATVSEGVGREELASELVEGLAYAEALVLEGLLGVGEEVVQTLFGILVFLLEHG